MAFLWRQSGELVDGGQYALFGCTVTPGFTPGIFEPGYIDQLKKQYPDRLSDILRFSVSRK